VHASSAPVCPLTLLAWRFAALSLTDLWWRYVELGGNRPEPALAGYLGGTAGWPDTEHNVLAHALNEGLWEMGAPSLAPYRERGDRGPESAGQVPTVSTRP
jgi:hypothetical protein